MNINYGLQSESIFLNAIDVIVADTLQGKPFKFCNKLNDAYFGGAIFAPKSFAALTSIVKPVTPYSATLFEADFSFSVKIYKKTSFSAVVGFAEGIPVIGSAIAAINGLYHIFGMITANKRLKNSVREFSQMGYEAARLNTSYFVFEAAIAYTMHRNHFMGSLISLIPLVKPIVRLSQGILFNINPKSE